ncbi:MAG: IS607 family transposase [Xenococcaceae cyanobacterium]
MYLTPQEAQRQFGFHARTLTRWATEGKIDFIKSPGGHRRYLQSSLEKIATRVDTRPTILYARVSTTTQKDDLTSQIAYLGSHYPGCKCVKDIGSGLNFRRKQFMGLMEQVAKGEIAKIVVGHKDRLCRFGFEFVEWFCNLHGCQIVVLKNNNLSPHEELMQDFMSIMHCFSSKLYFLRKYEKKISQEKISSKSDKTEKV